MNIRKYRKEIILFLDITIISAVSITLFCVSRITGCIQENNIKLLVPHLFLFIMFEIAAQHICRINESLWRYAESEEYLILLLGGLSSFIFFLIIDYIVLKSRISIMFSIAAYSVSLLSMLLMRLCYRQFVKRQKSKDYKDKIHIIIVGAGDAGILLQEEIDNNPNSKYKTICFIDDSIEKIGKKIHKIEVKGPIKDIEKLLADTSVREIVIAMPSVPSQKRREILSLCFQMKCRVRILPYTLELMQNKDPVDLWNNVRDIWIEELLGREQITLENEEVRKLLNNKVVMVTGGGGTIGSELCRQIAKEQPKCLIIVDIYENNAYDIQQELYQIYHNQLNLKIEIASVREKDKIDQLFRRYRPNIIFHAAAHKHVPLMEDCPEEAIKNNILGTYNMVLAADKYNVDKFVQISTDKAVNPTNIMGASKRFCEMILQSLKNDSKTEFVAVRFGNVLGSNGSVIPLFQKQIANGGPVTVTDKRIVRYFMTISEAVQLVLQAGSMASSSEVYVLDMGQPVKIINLAENLIRMSGHIPYTEIPIIETGLRPGEKLYEEILMKSEELIATSNHKIFIECQKEISKQELDKKLQLLLKSIETESIADIKRTMKKVVPTYRDPDEVNHNNMNIEYISNYTKNLKLTE